MPLVEQHGTIRVDACEVCHYLDSRPLLDRRLAHSLTYLAGWTVFNDLADASGPLSMRSIYVEQFAGDTPGVSAPLDPQHYLLALLAAPEIKLTAGSAEELR